MRKLPIPAVDDAHALTSLSRRGIHVRAVADRRADIEARYEIYSQYSGNPWSVGRVVDFAQVKTSLHNLYNSPPTALEFIKTLRGHLAGACPVCGRDALGTLDHYLPKDSYCEFSVYSRNLVPACDRCNNTRNDLVMGDAEGDRPAHPYFDDFLDRRVMKIVATPPWEAPKLTAVPIDVHGLEEQVVAWHIKNVIEPAGLTPYVIDLWAKLVEKPNLILGDGDSTVEGVRARLLRLAELEAHVGSSPNAWRSCFYYGVSESDGAAAYLLQLLGA